tara:strand:+ start:3670 stop:4218 length:549 start_codon:yes stop_codon:yes gene_type:complete
MLTKEHHKNIKILNKKYSLIDDANNLIDNTNNSVIILNICNNMNTFGAGFNKTIAKAFPAVKENYHLLGASKIKVSLGYTQFVKARTNKKYKNSIIIANMICQTGIISETNPRPLNYYYLGNCLYRTQEYIKRYNSEYDTKLQVYSPKFHMGVLGADWPFIKELILDTFKKPIFTQVYDNYL